MECLWRQKWSQLDGVGALIVSPTRELALQTYDVLRQVGCKHDFSAALIIGGTVRKTFCIFSIDFINFLETFQDFQFEKERICRTNIVVCTPGRILQHMDENPMFCCDNLQILGDTHMTSSFDYLSIIFSVSVLDEADRILDMGFKNQINAMVQNLPANRQTLLFSATQTK